MVLVDTSVWVAHLREGAVGLDALLNEGHVLCHPFVIGELACCNLKNRIEILSLLQAFPAAVHAEHEEVMHFIVEHGLMGKGLGYVDAHILVAAALTQAPLWTFDKKLQEASSRLGLSYG